MNWSDIENLKIINVVGDELPHRVSLNNGSVKGAGITLGKAALREFSVCGIFHGKAHDLADEIIVSTKKLRMYREELWKALEKINSEMAEVERQSRAWDEIVEALRVEEE